LYLKQNNTKLSILFKFFKIGGVAFIFLGVLRTIEYFVISNSHTVSQSFGLWNIQGFLNDVLWFSILSILLLPVFFLIALLNQKLATLITTFIYVCFFTFHTLLIFYFKESLIPLSVSDIYGMNQSQVELLIEIYGFKKSYLLLLIPIIIFFTVLFYIIVLKIKSKKHYSIAVIVLLISIGYNLIFPVQQNKFESKLNYQIVINKTYYFVNSYFIYQSENKNYLPSDINKALVSFYKNNDIQKQNFYDYPFFNETDVKDVLSPFFKKDSVSPNIVFIISESLGKQYSGENAILGSYTPFLDSLAEHSLYWQNMVANAERTFGVIPNLMAGVPDGKKGFLNLQSEMPTHLSLPLLLKENNNYQTAFFCGAWKTYDHMDSYLMFQKFDHILGKSNFNTNPIEEEIELESGEKKLFNWGAEDYQVFKESVEYMEKSYVDNKPFLNLYLSTSFHKPYAYTNQNKFEAKAERLIKQNVPKEKQADYFKHQSDFAAILYADYSMQQLFEMYKKSGKFENTIFIICGDHSLKFMNENPRLEKYHVPLIIYSPLLKRTKNSQSMICQKDVPSAIQALLKQTYNLNLPNYSISQTNNLDTLSQFSTTGNNYALMYASKRINNYIYDHYFLSDDMLFSVSENLKINKIENIDKQNELAIRMKNYKLLSEYVCLENKYLPQTKYDEFVKHKVLLDYKIDFTYPLTKPYTNFTISTSEFYSKPKSISSNKVIYFPILNNFHIEENQRVRVVVNYKIYSPSGSIPSLVFVSELDGELLNKKSVYLGENNDYIKPTNKKGWQNVSYEYWIEKKQTQKIGIYLFNVDQLDFYFDDLSIDIKVF